MRAFYNYRIIFACVLCHNINANKDDRSLREARMNIRYYIFFISHTISISIM